MVEHLVEAAAPERGRPVDRGREAELEVLADGEPWKNPAVLGNEAHPEAGDLVRRPSRQIHAVELDRPAPGFQEPHRGLHQRGLAHPVAAEERDRLAGAHLERDAEEDRRRPVAGVDVRHLKQR